MYDSLTRERESELKQLNAVHLQRVQAELNELKRSAMQLYIDSLGEEQPSVKPIINSVFLSLKSSSGRLAIGWRASQFLRRFNGRFLIVRFEISATETLWQLGLRL